MNSQKFVHLKIHTEYSIIDSIIKINSLIKKSKELNIKILSISDFSNFFGLIKFYESCCINDIKPIVGIDILVDNNDKYGITCLSLLSCNYIGYKNLIKIISNSKNNTKYKFPIINYSLLLEYSEGIIILSGGLNGYIGKCILNKDYKYIDKYLNLYFKKFNNKFYLEISRLGLNFEEYYIYKTLRISKKFSIPLVATNNVVFLNKNEFNIHKIRLSINEKINFFKINNTYTYNQYLKSIDEMIELFNDIPESIINSVEISKRCNTVIDLNNNYLPKFYKNFKYVEKYLTKISKRKLNKKMHKNIEDIKSNKNKIKTYYERLKKELFVINKMGYSGYFLIVMEFINWAKKNKISVGPGRGSGAGSLVSYVLEITELDPIKFNLIFERFLNPSRTSMPDLDIDFCIKKRDMVINHVIDKYGKDKVSKIITFGRMTAKLVIKDVGRILGYPYSFVDKISKMLPNFPKFKLVDAFKIENFLFLYNNDEDIKILIDIALKLEGIVKNIGKHAGGIVITPNKITDLIPLYFDNINNYYVTQFDKIDIEKIGLIKFDFLGLKTLSIINETVNNININKKNKFDIKKICLNDKKSFNMLKSTSTNAVFQLESKGIKDIIRRLKPDNFEDIVAIIALFRPGPIKSGMVDNFINRKNKLEKIYYPSKNLEHIFLKDILSSTYGIILYQEQIIQIAQKLSNFSLNEADLFRISLEKKQINEIKKQKVNFINGAIKNGISKELSEKIFYTIEKFSGYSFNRSHSVSYALISYRTLWLKSNYKEIFMSSVMNLDINNSDKINNLIKECKNMLIKLNNINLNVSKYEFYVNNLNEIEYGLGSIKGIENKFIKEIIKNRKFYGKFKNILDFSTRINLKNFRKKNLEILIKNNGLKFNNNDNIKIENLEKILNISKNYFNTINSNQIKMF